MSPLFFFGHQSVRRHHHRTYYCLRPFGDPGHGARLDGDSGQHRLSYNMEGDGQVSERLSGAQLDETESLSPCDDWKAGFKATWRNALPHAYKNDIDAFIQIIRFCSTMHYNFVYSIHLQNIMFYVKLLLDHSPTRLLVCSRIQALHEDRE